MSYRTNIISPEVCYRAFMTVKLHFSPTTSFDCRQYAGGLKKFDKKSFEKAKAKGMYATTAKMFKLTNYDNAALAFASNFLYNESLWIGDIVQNGHEVGENFSRAMKVKSALRYYVLDDTQKIINHGEGDFSWCMKSKDKIPALMTMVAEKTINPETLVVYDWFYDVLNIMGHHLDGPLRDLVYAPAVRRLRAYSAFVSFRDANLMKSLKKEIVDVIKDANTSI